MKYTFCNKFVLKLPEIYSYTSFAVSNNNKLFIFNLQEVKMFELDSKTFSSSIFDYEYDFKIAGCVNSTGEEILSWDDYEQLKLMNIHTTETTYYTPQIDEGFSNGFGKFKIAFIENDNYIIYNNFNYVEILSKNLLSKKNIIQLEDINTGNKPYFYYDEINKYLFTVFYYDLYLQHTKKNFSLIKIFDMNKFETTYEKLFPQYYNSLIYDEISNKIVCLKYSGFGYLGEYLDILELDKKNNNIEKLHCIEIENENEKNTNIEQGKFIFKNNKTNDIFFSYFYDNSSILLKKVNLDNFSLESIAILNTELDLLEDIIFTNDGKYLLLSDTKKIEIFEVNYN